MRRKNSFREVIKISDAIRAMQPPKDKFSVDQLAKLLSEKLEFHVFQSALKEILVETGKKEDLINCRRGRKSGDGISLLKRLESRVEALEEKNKSLEEVIELLTCKDQERLIDGLFASPNVAINGVR